MMKIVFAKSFWKCFKKLEKGKREKILEKLDVFEINPFSPQLKIEKLNPKRHNVYSFRVDYYYRVIFRFTDNGEAEILFVGHHHEIYDFSIFR